MFCSDGPHGIRKQEGDGDHLGLNASVPATCFPTAATVANSWDPELGEEIGKSFRRGSSSFKCKCNTWSGIKCKKKSFMWKKF